MASFKGITRRAACGYLLLGSCLLLLHRPLMLMFRLMYCGLSMLVCHVSLRPGSLNYVKGDSAPSLMAVSPTPNMIPRILHQIYKTSQVPSRWMEPHIACKTAHPEWEYHLWTDQSGRDFISFHHPWFLDTYDSYPFGVQRVDALRYLLLLTYGGFYLDLDVGCRYPLDPLRQYDMIIPETSPVGFSNDVMAAVPGHPLLKAMVRALPGWNRQFGSKYPTVMFSTGPMFLSLQYLGNPTAAKNVSILPRTLYNGGWQGFFAHYDGGSWHGKDAEWIQWLGEHVSELLMGAAAVLMGLLLLLGYCVLARSKRSQRALKAKD